MQSLPLVYIPFRWAGWVQEHIWAFVRVWSCALHLCSLPLVFHQPEPEVEACGVEKAREGASAGPREGALFFARYVSYVMVWFARFLSTSTDGCGLRVWWSDAAVHMILWVWIDECIQRLLRPGATRSPQGKERASLFELGLILLASGRALASAFFGSGLRIKGFRAVDLYWKRVEQLLVCSCGVFVVDCWTSGCAG